MSNTPTIEALLRTIKRAQKSANRSLRSVGKLQNKKTIKTNRLNDYLVICYTQIDVIENHINNGRNAEIKAVNRLFDDKIRRVSYILVKRRDKLNSECARLTQHYNESLRPFEQKLTSAISILDVLKELLKAAELAQDEPSILHWSRKVRDQESVVARMEKVIFDSRVTQNLRMRVCDINNPSNPGFQESQAIAALEVQRAKMLALVNEKWNRAAFIEKKNKLIKVRDFLINLIAQTEVRYTSAIDIRESNILFQENLIVECYAGIEREELAQSSSENV